MNSSTSQRLPSLPFRILLAFTASLVLFAQAPGGEPGRLSRQQAREDLVQLRTLLEASHPDPYLRAGGVLAFRRRFAAAEKRLPADGISRADFHRLLEPLVAQVGDGHTFLRSPGTPQGPRIWIELLPVDGRLVVSAVHTPDQKQALGAILESVDGVPVDRLLARMGERRGYENLYTNLEHLARALSSVTGLEGLLDRPLAGRAPAFTVRLSKGGSLSLQPPTGASSPGARTAPPSRIRLPEPDVAGMATGFLDTGGKTAYFRMDSSSAYREAFERWSAGGADVNAELERLVGKEGGLQEKLGRLPSVTERFKALMTDMKAKGTRLLIVDLRRNQGGHSCYADILEYFLHPLDQIAGRKLSGYQVRRYSELYFQNYPKDSLDRIRSRGPAHLQLGDLDFSDQEAWEAAAAGPATPAEQEQWKRDAATDCPTFAKTLEEGRWNAFHTPRVVVLCSAATFSAGLDGVLQLRRHGALVAGVPSSQAANCFIDLLFFRLKHSGLSGGLSFKWSVSLPGDPEAGRLLHPDLELTYDRYREMAFDPEASLLLALNGTADLDRREPPK